MKILILGANPNKIGFGSSIIRAFESQNHQVTAWSRPFVNFNNLRWIEKLQSVEFDVVIVSAFDHSNASMQLNVVEALFAKYKDDPTKHIVAIGSMSHYFDLKTPYAIAKRALHDFMVNTGKNSLGYECKLLLLEPGSMDNMLVHKHKYNFTYSTLDETAQMLHQFVTMNLKYLHVALRGANKSVDAPNIAE